MSKIVKPVAKTVVRKEAKKALVGCWSLASGQTTKTLFCLAFNLGLMMHLVLIVEYNYQICLCVVTRE